MGKDILVHIAVLIVGKAGAAGENRLHMHGLPRGTRLDFRVVQLDDNVGGGDVLGVYVQQVEPAV